MNSWKRLKKHLKDTEFHSSLQKASLKNENWQQDGAFFHFGDYFWKHKKENEEGK